VKTKKQLHAKIAKLKAEIADAHAFAYNILPNRTDELETTLDEQIDRLRRWIKQAERRLGIRIPR
jgi:hypothetical protein